MHGDFSVLNFDPYQHRRGVSPGRNGVLRNVNGVLHQQGRVTLDADMTEGQLLGLGWQEQAGRDVIGAGVAAIPAAEPDGFKVDAAFVADGEVHLHIRPGRAWADGILTRLAGGVPDAAAAVERTAGYFGPPLADATPSPDSIGDSVRDAVILEVSEESLHGFQYPERLIEPALGGPDTTERSYVNCRFRLLRLGPDEDCTTIRGRLADDPAARGRLSVTLAPAVVIAGDCPVVGGGGYTGFEHFLYRVEIAETTGPARFKWSQWNGGLAGRGRFDATVTPPKVVIDAGRTAIVSSGLAAFYLEALEYDDLAGTWRVTYASTATLNTDHDLELASPPVFGALPSTAGPVFFRLWNGLEAIADFTSSSTPRELRDGIRLVFDAPAAGNYRPGDYWTFTVRAGEIPNPATLIDNAPPAGVAYHRVPLAEINWTGRADTRVDGSIEDCRTRFRPLTNQKICCTYLIGDGVSSFGDFNSLEEAAAHLPAAGGELCLLPGFHRANLVLTGRRNVTIHGCERRCVVLPRQGAQGAPIIRLTDCAGVRIRTLDLITFDGTPIVIEGQREGGCRDIRIEDTRMIGRVNTIRATGAADLVIARSRLHLLDTFQGIATISVAADDALIERNAFVMMPFVDETPDEPDVPDSDPTRDPADPCATPEVLYAHPALVLAYASRVFAFGLALPPVPQPYRGIGGIHVRAGSERVRVLGNTIVGGAGNGITLGGDIDPPGPILGPAPTGLRAFTAAPAAVLTSTLARATAGASRPSAASRATIPRAAAPQAAAAVNVTASGQFLALVQDERGRPVADVDVYLEGPATASDRSDAQGMASIKTTPGTYTLGVSPRFDILSVAEGRDEGVVVNAVTVGLRAAAAAGGGFLHEITIDGNDISRMGLSGIGFVPRAGASPGTQTPPAPGSGPAAVDIADALVINFALESLLRTTTPVRDLVVTGNRLHHNLQNPFTDQLRAEAQDVGRGGISLGLVDSAVISGNHIHDNGRSAIDPVCGLFVGYGDNLEITDNAVAGNGVLTADFDQNRQAGVRGGLYIRFAGALTSRSSASTGHVPALRIHDNRVDQPAGRAVTAFAFGPVSVANNHLNSERSGRLPVVDTLVGALLIFNLGGIHRFLLRRASSFVGAADVFAAAAEASLPGGETLLDGNFVRLGSLHRSLTSQAVFTMDDVGYSANQASVFRRDPFLANVVLFGDSVRATSGRFREDAQRTISLLTTAFRMNITSMNQADHCIVVRPLPQPGNALPTIVAENQVLDAAFCARQFAEPVGLAQFVAQVFAASANELGGTPTLTTAPSAATSLQGLSAQFLNRSLAAVNGTQIAKTRAYQVEAERLADKHGAGDPRTATVRAQADAGAQISRLVSIGAEAATVRPPVTTAATSAISGRFVNEKGFGQPGVVVELVRPDGSRVATVGRTDAAGFYSSTFDQAGTAALGREGNLHLRFVDDTGKEMIRAAEAVTIAPGADIRSTVTVPVRVVPKSTVTQGTVIFTRAGGDQSQPPPSGAPPVSGAPPATGVPPSGAPPVTGTPPVTGVPPVTSQPPVSGQPPTPGVPPVSGQPAGGGVPPVTGVPPTGRPPTTGPTTPPATGGTFTPPAGRPPRPQKRPRKKRKKKTE